MVFNFFSDLDRADEIYLFKVFICNKKCLLSKNSKY